MARRKVVYVAEGKDAATVKEFADFLEISESSVAAEDVTIPIAPRDADKLELTEADRGMLEGGCGPAMRQDMRILCALAAQQGAQALVDVSQVHIDGCIYASAANLTFAERMAELRGHAKPAQRPADEMPQLDDAAIVLPLADGFLPTRRQPPEPALGDAMDSASFSSKRYGAEPSSSLIRSVSERNGQTASGGLS